MDLFIALLALGILITAAYRGYSVILFAPIAAMLAVLLTDPNAVPTVFSGLFMDKMVGFIRNYFPVFLLGAVFGKCVELAGFSKAIVSAVIRVVGSGRAIVTIVLVCGLLTYGGVSLFVVVFAVYPFAAEMFRQGDIPKRLIPATIALGSFTFSMDSLPGSPQIQNIIPTTFFKTDTWAAPWLGTIAGVLVLGLGLAYLDWRRRVALAAGEGYGEGHFNEPEPVDTARLAHPAVAILPLIVVGVLNLVFTKWIEHGSGETIQASLAGLAQPLSVQRSAVKAIWAVEGALIAGIVTVFVFAFNTVRYKFAEGSKHAIGGALLATMNTASEFGFGGVIAVLPGFLVVKDAIKTIPNPLVNEAITVTTLAGMTGSASGGMSIALAAMANDFLASAQAHGIPPQVLHRIASIASGGMDTLPHNGAIITLMAVTGLTHRQAYKDIFVMTVGKTLLVFVVIGIYYATGIV